MYRQAGDCDMGTDGNQAVLRLSHAGTALPASARTPVRRARPRQRVGVISNPRSHLNQQRSRALNLTEGVVIKSEPETPEALVEALREFSKAGVDLIVIDGGDGTVREVLGAAFQVYGGRLPRLAVLPSGKTNALAFDLGIPMEWTLTDILEAHEGGRIKLREPLEIQRDGTSAPSQRGFIFGSGAFVRATTLAQRVHSHGWFNGIAILLSLTAAVLQTFFGSSSNPWRRGERVSYSFDGKDIRAEQFYTVMATTLKRMPVAIKPFGPVRAGLKFLAVTAPPRSLLLYLPPLLMGSMSARLRKAGYHQGDADRIFMSFKGGFILDGEHYPGGHICVRKGKPLEFVAP